MLSVVFAITFHTLLVVAFYGSGKAMFGLAVMCVCEILLIGTILEKLKED